LHCQIGVNYFYLLFLVNDEININENVTEIINYIQWNQVNFQLVISFIMKYSKVLDTSELELLITNGVTDKVMLERKNKNEKNLVEELMNQIIGKIININIFRDG
jgi:hypothetical protein